MPSQTAGGLPYPLPTEPVRDGAVAIKNLADALEAKGHGLLLQAGGFSITPDVTGRFYFAFPKVYSAQPWVAMTPGNSPPEGMVVVAVDTPLQITNAGVHGTAMKIVPGGGISLVTVPFYLVYIAVGVA